MKEILLFTDGSLNTQTKIGYGAYLIVENAVPDIELLKPLVKVKRFEQSSSTKLELQILLYALDQFSDAPSNKIMVYTDSQNIVGLMDRRARYDRNGYLSKKKCLINNHLLYKEFYIKFDLLDISLIKVKGHQATRQKNAIDKLFALVDKASRKALRSE